MDYSMTKFNPQLDLKFEREVELTQEQIWDGWTNPDTLMKWFCPRPWKVVECEIDLKPGGIFKTTMQSPEGVNMPEGVGTFLIVEPYCRLVWTNLLGPGFRPSPKIEENQAGFTFVVDLKFEKLPTGKTKYIAHVMHPDELSRKTHEDMGFEQGWGIALDQLVELKTSGK